VRRAGVRSLAIVQAVALLLSPPALLVLTVWLFALWSGQSLHTVLCLILAPVVFIAHSYALRSLISSTILLPRQRMFMLQIGGVICCVTVDVAACIAVAIWFI
jgi:hypothetical protein